MITNKGNDIIAKYMLGQAPEYAAYIAVGIGAKPLASAESDTSSQTKRSMDFEAFRIPVTSRGIVNDTITKLISKVTTATGSSTFTTTTQHGINVGDTVSVIINSGTPFSVTVSSTTSNTFVGPTSLATGTVFTSNSSVSYVKDRLIFKGQVPPDHKYQMTEIALYPAINDQLMTGHDSRILASFSVSEPWQVFGNSSSIQYVSDTISDGSGNIIAFPNSAKFIDIDNMAFSGSSNRKSRYEQPRFLDRSLIVAGNLTTFSNSSMSEINSGTYLTNGNFVVDLSKYSANDVVKLAVSIVSNLETPNVIPHETRIRVDFVDTENRVVSMKKTLYSTDISTSRYAVLSSKISELENLDNQFNWSKINKLNVYVQTLNASSVYDNSYVILDGLRIDNETTTNPLYGMVAYSKLKNSVTDSLPIEKTENSQGYIEYRLGVSIF